MSKKHELNFLIEKANIIHNNKYDYSLIHNHKNMSEIINIVCPTHGVFNQTFHHHINKKRGCKHCAIDNVTDNIEIFTKKAKSVHDNKYDYSLAVYIKSDIPIIIICKTHGKFEQKPKDHINNKAGCPICNFSKGEDKIKNYLEYNKIEYKYQYKFNECKNIKKLVFDFYLPEQNICIEFDGEQHFRSVEGWGGEKTFNYIKNDDNIKTKFCLDNNIELIRISYKEYENIENILNLCLKKNL